VRCTKACQNRSTRRDGVSGSSLRVLVARKAAPDHARATGEFPIRDSKTPDGPHLTLTNEGFTGLVEFAKHHG